MGPVSVYFFQNFRLGLAIGMVVVKKGQVTQQNVSFLTFKRKNRILPPLAPPNKKSLKNTLVVPPLEKIFLTPMALGLGLSFTFYIYYVSAKPTAFLLCVTFTLQVAVKQGFKYEDPRAVLYPLPCLYMWQLALSSMLSAVMSCCA